MGTAPSAPGRGQAEAAEQGEEEDEEEEEREDVREAHNILRQQGLWHFTDSLLRGPEASWRRRLLFCSAGDVSQTRLGKARKKSRKLLWKRPRRVLSAMLMHIEGRIRGRSQPANHGQCSKKETAATNPACVAAMSTAEQRGIWRMGKAIIMQLRLHGVLLYWQGTDAGQSILARMLAHAVQTAAQAEFKTPAHGKRMDFTALSRALHNAVGQVEATIFGGFPLPLRFGSCLEIRSAGGTTRVHSKYFDAPWVAMRYRRLQQLVRDSHGTKAGFKRYRGQCTKERLSEHAAPPAQANLPAKLERLCKLVKVLLADSGQSRKRKAPEPEVVDVTAPPQDASASSEAPAVPAIPDVVLVEERCRRLSQEARDIQHQILRYTSFLPPFFQGLNQLAQQGQDGSLSERNKAVMQAVRASSVNSGPSSVNRGPPVATVPPWFLHWCRALGDQQAIPELWAAVLRHPRVKAAAEEAFAEVRANRFSSSSLLDRPSSKHGSGVNEGGSSSSRTRPYHTRAAVATAKGNATSASTELRDRLVLAAPAPAARASKEAPVQMLARAPALSAVRRRIRGKRHL